MKLVRYGPTGAEKPGIVDADGTLRDLSGIIDDVAGETLSPPGLEKLRSISTATLPEVRNSERIGPCVGKVGKFICVGLNYADHAKESGAEPPKEPVLFMKATSAICGPNDDVVIPRNSKKTDWEVELGVVIGQDTRYVEKADALRHVAGYCVINDLSEREFQLERGGQWVKGKSADTFAPVGPFLATPDEIADPHALDMWLTVNGVTRQKGTTANMVFGVQVLVSYVSQFMTLLPGDVISTGTPAGVGLGIKPEPVYLKPGDVVELGIDGLGRSRQEVIAYA